MKNTWDLLLKAKVETPAEWPSKMTSWRGIPSMPSRIQVRRELSELEEICKLTFKCFCLKNIGFNIVQAMFP